MLYFVALFLGVITGGVCVFILLSRRFAEYREWQKNHAAEQRKTQETLDKARKYEAELKSRFVTIDELSIENSGLKTDLRNLDIEVRKLKIDRDQQRLRQDDLDNKVADLGQRYLKENVKWIGQSLNQNNFAACKQRLLDVIGRCRSIGYDVLAAEENQLVGDLRAEFEKAVKAAFEREEQARIKAQIREEQEREREIQRELKRLDREKAAIQAALDKALAEAKDAHSAEVEELRARLADAEQRAQRAVSQAQLTKSGHVYVISNIGSFGEGVFKVGMTRRLEPHDRVRELSDASVPFPFDVHMMISSDDAPSLENALHRALFKHRLNKTNPRKEFFKSTIESISQMVKEHHGEVDYVADPEALEYRQSVSMSDDDADFIEHVYDNLDDEESASIAK